VQERMALLGDSPAMLGFFFVQGENLEYQGDALAGLPENTGLVLSASMNALELVEESNWNAAEIQAALQAALIDGLGLKPRVAYGPLRVAASGRKVSPPLFESLELLGKAESIARLDRLSGRLA
jgi:glutamyl-tRNA synthetase